MDIRGLLSALAVCAVAGTVQARAHCQPSTIKPQVKVVIKEVVPQLYFLGPSKDAIARPRKMVSKSVSDRPSRSTDQAFSFPTART